MKLLVISHTPHHLKDGRLVAWGPTVRELDYLAWAFGSVVHLAPFHRGPAPEVAVAYTSREVEFFPLRPSGGVDIAAKIGALTAAPGYFQAIRKAMRGADVIQVRCPCNVGLVACLVLALNRRRPRWAKYAGNWKPTGGDPLSYRAQRWWLQRRLHGGPVTVNGEWPRQPQHVHSFVNPCLSEAERIEAAKTTDGKTLSEPVRLLFVGRTETAKGIGRSIEILARLVAHGHRVTLDVAGDGPERSGFERMADGLGVADVVTFHGWVSRSELESLYERAHFVLLPSTASEGWPKVLSEAMAFRAVPLAGAVSSIGQIISRTEAGRAFPPEDITVFVNAVQALVAEPARWDVHARAGVGAARLFTYEAYVSHLKEMLGLELHEPEVGASFLSPSSALTPEDDGAR